MIWEGAVSSHLILMSRWKKTRTRIFFFLRIWVTAQIRKNKKIIGERRIFRKDSTTTVLHLPEHKFFQITKQERWFSFSFFFSAIIKQTNYLTNQSIFSTSSEKNHLDNANRKKMEKHAKEDAFTIKTPNKSNQIIPNHSIQHPGKKNKF